MSGSGALEEAAKIINAENNEKKTLHDNILFTYDDFSSLRRNLLMKENGKQI